MTSLPQKAIAKFGPTHQILKSIEELQELTIELATSLSTENGCDELDRLSIIRRARNTAEVARVGFQSNKKELDAYHLMQLSYEVADVCITLEQILHIFDIHVMFEKALGEKKDRLRKMIEEATA